MTVVSLFNFWLDLKVCAGLIVLESACSNIKLDAYYILY